MRRRAATLLGYLGIVLLMASVGIAVAEDAVTTPFKGIRVTLRNIEGPPREAIFVAEIDLKAPGIRFTTTEPNGDAPRDTNTETVPDFVARRKAQFGVNANFFVLDYKDDTDVRGLAFSDGKLVSPWEEHENALNISADNVATFVHPAGEDAKETKRSAKATKQQATKDVRVNAVATVPKVKLYNAVGGGRMLVEQGKSVVEGESKRQPRTCVALKDEHTLLLVVVDGRQPDHSEGMTYQELATLLIGLGAREGMELDGGGSATFVVANPTPTVLNVPLTTAVPAGIKIGPPGILRKNGNNIAVFAEK